MKKKKKITRNETMMNVRVTESEKKRLIALARSKGCEGWTAFVKLLAHAKDVVIKS